MEGSRQSGRLKNMLSGPAGQNVRRLARNRLVLYALAPALVLVGVLVFFALNANRVSTDDAVVAAARVAISAEVRGRITEVHVHDNQLVHAGDVLITLDDTDYRSAVMDAEARLASARLQVASLRAGYSEAAAQTSAAQAQNTFAQRELARQRELFAAGVSSRHDVEDAQRAAQVAAHQAAASGQSQTAALANIGGQARTPIDQHPLVLQAQAALIDAQSNLDHTTIRAPQDGIVARVEQVQVGSYVQPAQSLFWLISGAPWIEAAFKENQLGDLAPGQPTEIHIDAYPHTTFHGHVMSMSPGTGSSFSVLPAQNASGNWVKVVQRVAVRIAVDDPPEQQLAIGLSARVRVDTSRRTSDRTALRGREPE